MTDPTYSLEYRCAQALAREAGKRLILERDQGFDILSKGTNDLVTDVDRSVETYLRDQLAMLFPKDHILGEEFGESAHDSPHSRAWLLDPIDGTTNFSKGIPIYCVSIGMQVQGQSVLGVIYDPTRDELFSGLRGHGATLNGRTIRAATCSQLEDAVLATGFPPLKRDDSFEQIVTKLARVLSASRGVRRLGSAALDLAYVAAGRLDGFWEYGLHPWDTAAGYLIAQEAGASVTDDAGQDYRVTHPSIVVANPALHPQLLGTLARGSQ